MRRRLDEAQIKDAQESKHYDGVQAGVQHQLKGLGRKDAEDLTIYGAMQLTELETQIQEQVEPDLTALLAFLHDYTGSTGAAAHANRTGEAKGISKIIGNSGKDFPNVELGEKMDIIPAENYGLEYSVTLQDIDEAMFAGTDINNEKALQIGRGMDEGINNCLWRGDKNLPGLISPANLANYNEFTDFGATKLREMSANDAKDMLVLMKRASNTFRGKLPVDTLLCCDEDYDFITTAELNSVTNKLLVEFLMEIGIKNIVSCPELAGMMAGGKDGLFLFPRDIKVVKAKLPGGTKRALPAFYDGWAFITKYVARCSGLHVRIPGKITYAKY
jgi:hypothetical protein